MRFVRPLSRATLVALVTSAFAACAVDADDIDTGVSIPLTTTTPLGNTYRLSNATFTFTGPESLTVSSGDEATLEVALTPGSYQLELATGWRMERLVNGAAQPVDAVLVSQPVQQISVQPGALTQAYYQFLLSAEGGSGSVSISFGVTEAATLSGTLNVSLPGCDPATNCPAVPVVAQFAFPPLVPEPSTTDVRQLLLRGSGVVATFYTDTASTAGDQLAGASVLMQLRAGDVTVPTGLQQLTLAIANQVGGVQVGISVGPATVQNGLDATGFPAVPSELTFDAPFTARFLDGNNLPVDLQGTSSFTYRAPSACSPDGTGCGNP